MTRRPLRVYWFALLAVGLTALAVTVLDWDLSALASAEERSRAWGRVTGFLASFGTPDLSSGMLQRGMGLALETLSIALIGVALAAVLAWPLAVLASRSVMQDVDAVLDADAPRQSVFLREAARVVLDVLRGVPDFAWALLVHGVTGHGPATGVLAITISVAGILGKIYSELWDAIDPRAYAALRSTGASRLAVLLYGIQPLAARAMLSFTLMRTECAVRNASVIGIVGGGGIGVAVFDELKLGHYDQTVTLLLFMLALTASADLAANLLRRQFRIDPNHPRATRDTSLRAGLVRRGVGIAAVVGLLGLCAWWVRDGLGARLAYELHRVEWGWIWAQYSQLLLPSLDADVWARAARESLVPLALGWLATLLSVGLAAALVYPGSVAFRLEPERFTGERVSGVRRAARASGLLAARLAALMMRGVPEVAWVLIFGHLFRLGVLAGLCGVVMHSAGVLARVFTETVDNVEYRRLEQAFYGSRSQTFLWGALPESLQDWKTYAMFQLEVNVRLGVVLGIVGIGGLGDVFDSRVQFWQLREASVFLIAMVLLTVGLDRVSRALKTYRLACSDA